ncbi:MAG: T9SS type A sorting domain-containing protein [Bacteroidota bacterium]|nr:T9SS type A sorting domain-containing protein [Bacteroidota bacterium]
MKNTSILFGLLLITTSLFAQSFDWAAGMGGAGDERGKHIAVDAAGNVYTVGEFELTVDFDPGPAVYELTSNGSKDIFISKFDANGNFIWVKIIGNGYGNSASSFCIDTNANILITGGFIGTMDFDPGPGVSNLVATSGEDCFIVKLNSSGNFVWAKSIDGTNTISGHCIETDANRNIYVSGQFAGTTDFDPGPNVYNLTDAGGSDMFIVKLDSSGNFMWAKNVGGADAESPSSMILDAVGNIYITGQFSGNTDFDPGTGVLVLPWNGWQDIFISKFDTVGNIVWAKGMGGADDDAGISIDVDVAGNVFFVAEFCDTIDCDPGPSVFNLVSNSSTNVFVSKFDAAGNFVLAKNLGKLTISNGKSMEIGSAGNIYVTGDFQDTTDFGQGNASYNLISNGSNDIFIVKLNTNGNFVWTRNMGGGSFWPADRGYALTLDPSGNIYATGFFGIEADLDPGPGVENLSSAGLIDVFVVKLNPCPDNTNTITETACFSFDFYGTEITTSGIYNHPIMTTEGCDSVIRLNLTINIVDTSLTQNANTLQSNAVGATYQWIDCANGNTIIAGATSQSYTSTVNGSFAVIVNENGCTDTSACYTISNIGIDKLINENFSLFPNPAKDKLIISSSSETIPIARIEIYNLSGQLLRNTSINKKQGTIDVSDLPPGNYFIRAIGNCDVWVKKIVVLR